MNLEEAAQVVAILSATWPRFELTDATFERYAIELDKWPQDVGREAAVQLGRTEEYFPTVRALADACRQVVRSRNLAPLELEEDTGPPLSTQQQLENVARVRELIGQIRKTPR